MASSWFLSGIYDGGGGGGGQNKRKGVVGGAIVSVASGHGYVCPSKGGECLHPVPPP